MISRRWINTQQDLPPLDLAVWIETDDGIRVARPQKADKDKRKKIFQVRLSETERERIKAAAEVKALDESAWARMVLLEQAQPILK